jgi:hypothetical protein
MAIKSKENPLCTIKDQRGDIMPGDMKKADGGYNVEWGGKTTAKKTSKAKGQAQLNLLRAIEHGWKPTGKPPRQHRGLASYGKGKE